MKLDNPVQVDYGLILVAYCGQVIDFRYPGNACKLRINSQ
jgi:hypothetical protein